MVLKRWQWIEQHEERKKHCMTALTWTREGKRTVGRPEVD